MEWTKMNSQRDVIKKQVLLLSSSKILVFLFVLLNYWWRWSRAENTVLNKWHATRSEFHHQVHYMKFLILTDQEKWLKMNFILHCITYRHALIYKQLYNHRKSLSTNFWLVCYLYLWDTIWAERFTLNIWHLIFLYNFF